MRSFIAIAAALIIPFISFGQLRFYKYPAAVQGSYVEHKFGIATPDPFKELENLESAETKKWIEEESKATESYRRSIFSKYTNCRNYLLSNLRDNYHPLPLSQKDDRIQFSLRYVDEAPSIYYKKGEAEWSFLCGTTRFQQGKKDKIYVRQLSVSRDEKYVAITVSNSGSDWHSIYILNLATRDFLPEEIKWSKYGRVIWNATGFYYSACDTLAGNSRVVIDKNQRIMFHTPGQPGSADKTIISNEGAYEGHIGFHSVDTGRTLIFYFNKKEGDKTFTNVAYADAAVPGSELHPFIKTKYNPAYEFSVLGNSGNNFYVKSTYKAPNGQISIYDGSGLNLARVVVDQYSQPIRSASVIKDRIFCVYFDKGRFMPFVFDTAGTFLKKLDIPDGYSISGFTRRVNDSTTTYTLNSFQSKSRTVKFDFKHLKTIIYDENTGAIFSPNYTSKLIFYPSKDSTLIPMYVVFKNKFAPDTSRHLMLYAYGGFDISTDPFFDPGFSLFMQSGGILAVPLIRGGGELGSSWHKDGTKLNKQKSFDDFIASADFLVKNGWASPDKIIATGGSNGGLLVGAALAQRPDLFKAVIPRAAVLDLVNMPRMVNPISSGLSEYGNPDDSLEYDNLCKLSPLQHIKKGVQYPATLLMFSDHDDRVMPANSYKFLAALQSNTKEQILPYFAYAASNEGHVMEGSYEDITGMAFMYAFIFENLGMDVNAISFIH